MELRIIVDALVRPSTSCMNTFLIPSTTLRRSTHTHIHRRPGDNRSVGRHFSSSASRNVDWEPTTTSAAPPPKQTDSQSSTSPKDVPVSDLVASLGWNAKTRKPQPYHDMFSYKTQEEKFNKGNTANDIMKALNMNLPGTEERYKKSGFDSVGKVPSQFSLDGMRTDIHGSPQLSLLSQEFSGTQMIQESPKRALMKLGPSAGRTVEIGGGNISIERGFNLLNSSCARNQVRGDFYKQKFHERPGMKRKRLASLRWRKQFKEGFLAAIARTKKLTKQGW